MTIAQIDKKNPIENETKTTFTIDSKQDYQKINKSLNNISDLHEQARAFMAEHEIYFDKEFYETGDREQIKFAGREGDRNKHCWLKCLHLEREAGDIGLCITFGSHHTDLPSHITKTFWPDCKSLTDEEKKVLKERRIQQKQNAEIRSQEQEKQANSTADWCIQKFDKALKNGSSPYIDRKKIHPCEIRFESHKDYLEDRSYVEETIILIPIRNIKGNIRALQEIYPSKRKFKDDDKHPRDKNTIGSYSGCFFTFGKIVNGQPINICEGYGTGNSIFFSTDITTLMAVSRTNLLNVGTEIKKRYPACEITFCADDEPDGKKDAINAAHNLKCKLCIPSFPIGKELDKDGKPNKDFNDLMRACGKDEVKRQIENAKTPDQLENEAEKDKSSIDDAVDIEAFGSDEIDKELAKANANSRRRALIYKSTLDEIIKDICKQHPKFRDRAKDVATKALLWAKSFQTGCEVIVNGIPKTITDMISLDSRLAQLEAPGQPCVIVNRRDALPITNADYNKRLSGEVVVVGVNEKGQPKYVAANKFWEGNTHKHIYRNIVFTNKPTSNNDYNLFTGFGIKPKQGSCEKILNHIKEVVCAGIEINNTAFVKLLAWQIQNIGRPSRIITGLKSIEQQIGKGCLLGEVLAPIYGNAGFTTSDTGQVIGRFNDTIRGRAFIFLDECLIAGDRKAADAIKSLATATRIGVESKGVPTVQFPCAANLFFSTNHPDAAHIEEADARYWILEVSPHRKGDINYFEELYAEINGSGLSAFMHHLLTIDVRGFVPQRDVPTDNEAKNKMIRNSINPYDARKWLEECCLARMILGCAPGGSNKEAGYRWELWQKGEEYENGVFFTAYTEWQKTVRSPVKPKPTAANNFGALLNTAGLELRIDRERRRTLPDSNDCLKKVTEMLEKTGKK